VILAHLSTSVGIGPTFGLQSDRKISSIVVTRVTRRLAVAAQTTTSAATGECVAGGVGQHRKREPSAV
jgi:hypothetical protein